MEVFDDANVDPGRRSGWRSSRRCRPPTPRVVIVSDHQSDFIAKEVETARRLGLPISPIVVGGPRRPADLADVAALTVDSSANLPFLAGAIADGLRKIGSG